ncbi:hypothetical protein ACLOJK_031114 [Asimina triloba]
MRPRSTTSNSGDGFRWNSPIPYLFGGLAAMLLLIAVALIILACSYHRSRRRNNSRQLQDDEKPSKAASAGAEAHTERKIVVIMAGEDQPTFIAKPVVVNPIHPMMITSPQLANEPTKPFSP